MICSFILRNLVKKLYYIEVEIELVDFDEENENEVVVIVLEDNCLYIS